MTRLVQITDVHLGETGDFCLRGFAVWPRFLRLLARARALAPDLLLLSGDLTHDAGAEALALLDAALAGFPCPVAVIPGNHDDVALLAAYAPAERADVSWRQEWRLPGLRLLTLNSARPGRVEGALDLDALSDLLDANPGRPTWIALHHPPVPVGAPWMAVLGLDDAEGFWTVLARHPQVQAVLCGHVHQPYDVWHTVGAGAGQPLNDGARSAPGSKPHAAAVRVLCTPASSIQFHPSSPEFALAPALPGLRWLDFEDGALRATGVERVHPQLDALVVPDPELRARLAPLGLPFATAGAGDRLGAGGGWSAADLGPEGTGRFEAWLQGRGVRVLELDTDAGAADGLIALLTGVPVGLAAGRGHQ